MYGASATLGFGGSMLLVTVLTMLADLIGQNVVRPRPGGVLCFCKGYDFHTVYSGVCDHKNMRLGQKRSEHSLSLHASWYENANRDQSFPVHIPFPDVRFS